MKAFLYTVLTTVVGGLILYWATQGYQEYRKEEEAKEQRAREAREASERLAAQKRDAAAAAAAAANAAAAAEAKRIAELPKMQAPDVNYNLQGGDYKNFVSGDLNSCLRACEAEKPCVAITFRKDSRQCWMKNSVPLRSPDPLYISAVKVG